MNKQNSKQEISKKLTKRGKENKQKLVQNKKLKNDSKGKEIEDSKIIKLSVEKKNINYFSDTT